MEPSCQSWKQIELVFHAQLPVANPYVDLGLIGTFVHESGREIVRPGFWCGGSEWRIRFAAPWAGQWSWSTESGDHGLAHHRGTIQATASPDEPNRFYRHGFWRMSPGCRNLIHADGTPAVVVADTAWALPFRATLEQAALYTKDRRSKGFCAALLMTVQPDMEAAGPRDRSADEGFDVAFEDLPTGRLSQLNPAYFEKLDELIAVLVEHEIVPVLQPVFFGYGWKGLNVAGPAVPPSEYARYCRYLVARYGAGPAIYLVGGDGTGEEPQVAAGGSEVHAWDAYAQPTGIHYRPHARNRACQDAEWLDFQWGQTGHSGAHLPERVADMWRNEPAKGVANGEPTYENMGALGRAAGWWQGHEAWCNLCAGGTMGVVYGAGSLWQWRLSPHEPGHQEWCIAEGAGWREALDFEGSTHVGRISRILEGLPIEDIEPDWTATMGGRTLFKPGRLLISYQENGGELALSTEEAPLEFRVVDPSTGEILARGTRSPGQLRIPGPSGRPLVYILHRSSIG